MTTARRDPLQFDVLVVGAGPAGLAAAWAASQNGKRAGLIDDNPAAGGQIWRGRPDEPWIAKALGAGVRFLPGASVIAAPEPNVLLAEVGGAPQWLQAGRIVLATGARERFLPFPGWTLPNVLGAGALQAMVKGGLPIAGKRVVVAGSGPLLLAVADFLRRERARVLLIAEQTPRRRIRAFARSLLRHPTKLAQGAALRARLAGIPYRADCWPIRAEGRDRLETVTLLDGGRTRTIACDYLAAGFGLVPNTELAALSGCRVDNGAVATDRWQQTTVQGVYAAGEITGIGGVELSSVEGEIAGFAAAGDPVRATALFPQRERSRRFARTLDHAFPLRPELASLAQPNTVVCRCEDVTLEAIAPHRDWRSAKLRSRCGMGPCQGRVCGPAVEFLLGWPNVSVRPPLTAVRLSSLLREDRGAGCDTRA